MSVGRHFSGFGAGWQVRSSADFDYWSSPPGNQNWLKSTTPLAGGAQNGA